MIELKAKPPRLDVAERTRLVAMTPDEIGRMAAADEDNPPMSEDERARAAFAQTVKRIRERSGLPQSKFSERYRISLGRLRDWEQGGSLPTLSPGLIWR